MTGDMCSNTSSTKVTVRRRILSLERFKRSAPGAKLAALFSSNEAIERMIRKSEAGRPAVEAIGRDVAERVGALDDEQKKLVGRWAKEVLATRGWTPARKGRVAAGNFFARGTIYRRSAGHGLPLGDGPARLAAAQALVRALSHPVMSSDELIAERRGEFEKER